MIKLIFSFDPKCLKCNGTLKASYVSKPGKEEIIYCDCVLILRESKKGRVTTYKEIR